MTPGGWPGWSPLVALLAMRRQDQKSGDWLVLEASDAAVEPD
jgi:hypothetical protein